MGKLLEVLLIKGLGGNLDRKFEAGWKLKEGGGESWESLAEDIYNVNS